MILTCNTNRSSELDSLFPKCKATLHGMAVLMTLQGWGEAEGAALQSPLPHRVHRPVALFTEAIVPRVQA